MLARSSRRVVRRSLPETCFAVSFVRDTNDILVVFNLDGRHRGHDGRHAFFKSFSLVGAEPILQDGNADLTLILARDYRGLFSLST